MQPSACPSTTTCGTTATSQACAPTAGNTAATCRLAPNDVISTFDGLDYNFDGVWACLHCIVIPTTDPA